MSLAYQVGRETKRLSEICILTGTIGRIKRGAGWPEQIGPFAEVVLPCRSLRPPQPLINQTTSISSFDLATENLRYRTDDERRMRRDDDVYDVISAWSIYSWKSQHETRWDIISVCPTELCSASNWSAGAKRWTDKPRSEMERLLESPLGIDYM